MNYMTRLLLGAWSYALECRESQRGRKAGSATRTSPKNDTSAADAAAANDPDYKVGPQDVRRIDVWKRVDIPSHRLPCVPTARFPYLLNEVAGLIVVP